MIQRWIDIARLAASTPSFIERRSVQRTRARLQQRTLGLSQRTGLKQILVDVSVIHRHDAGTGIQRIVRAVLNQLLSDPPAGYVVRPVAASRKQAYRYIDWDGAGIIQDEEGQIHTQSGDIFLGLDLSAHIIPAHRHQLAEWKAQGAALHFMVYDLLPLHHPEWFSGKLVAAFRRWIKAVAVLADSAICISPTVEADIAAWFKDRYGLAPGSIPTRVIPMGWDIASTKPSHGLPPNFEKIMLQIQQRKTVLMVGTLEPRKGHAQVLEAYQRLWDAEQNYNLVIVGHPGWKTEKLQARLRHHPQRNQRLFWLDDASDEALLKLYRACDGVIIASLAEGFGLPLIEALSHGKPVLARDLPVFRDQSQSGIEYFTARDGVDLSIVLASWLQRIGDIGERSMPKGHQPSWKETVSAIVAGFESTHSDLTSGISVKELKFWGTV